MPEKLMCEHISRHWDYIRNYNLVITPLTAGGNPGAAIEVKCTKPDCGGYWIYKKMDGHR